MEIHAYILMEIETGKVREVAEKLAALPEVVVACAVTGPYDIIAGLRVPSIEAIGELITNHIHVLPGIRKTTTCLCTSCRTGK